MEKDVDGLMKGMPELARNSSVSFKLEGWPAAAVLVSISVSVVCIYAMRTQMKK